MLSLSLRFALPGAPVAGLMACGSAAYGRVLEQIGLLALLG